MKPDFKMLWKTRKKWILAAGGVLTAAALGCGTWYYVGHNQSEPVPVFPFHMVGMTEYWGDSQESYGPVTTDKIQTVFLTETQAVTEILVKEGDTVKKGDLLMTFDTTLSDLSLERKRLDVEKKKLQLTEAQAKLWEINQMKPMVIPDDNDEDIYEEADPDLGYKLESAYKISSQIAYDGSSAGKALICWIRDDVDVTADVFEDIRQKAVEYQTANQPDPEEPELPEDEEDEEEAAFQILSSPSVPVVSVNSYYVVFKVTAGNMSAGATTLWQGMKVTGSGKDFSFRFTTPAISDHMNAMLGIDSDYEAPEVDYGSGYTAAQIAQMRSEQQKKIRELEFDIKMAEAEYKIMQREVSDGNVYADIDGQVISVLTQEESQQSMQPILKVSGGGGFYVEGFVSELEKDNLKPGQEVTVNDWHAGTTYTGTIDSIGDFPTAEGYWTGLGNPTASYYPFHVFVDGSADLQEGRYVNVLYSSAESTNGIYLENPFLRAENGKQYVYVLGEDGRLEQRFVTTGKSLWGSYTEILSGLTPEDLVAFPYGKNIRPGVAAQEGDLSNLYN